MIYHRPPNKSRPPAYCKTLVRSFLIFVVATPKKKHGGTSHVSNSTSLGSGLLRRGLMLRSILQIWALCLHDLILLTLNSLSFLLWCAGGPPLEGGYRLQFGCGADHRGPQTRTWFTCSTKLLQSEISTQKI